MAAPTPTQKACRAQLAGLAIVERTECSLIRVGREFSGSGKLFEKEETASKHHRNGKNKDDRSSHRLPPNMPPQPLERPSLIYEAAKPPKVMTSQSCILGFDNQFPKGEGIRASQVPVNGGDSVDDSLEAEVPPSE